jgi:ketosteroid isomerase-like protein
MTKSSTSRQLFTGLLLSFAFTATAQTTPPPNYRDVVVDNPNAEADIAVVASFVNSLTSGDLVKAKALMAPGFTDHGPAGGESRTADEVLAGWKERYNIETNRKASFVTQTFRVASGDLKGDWVSMWGDYTFTTEGTTVTLPYQYTARVKDGKIEMGRIYYDSLSVMKQLGYTLTPPAKK